MAPLPIPHGFHTATPYLIVRHAEEAVAFYEKAFGATPMMAPLRDPTSGSIVHGELKIGNSPIMITEENPDWGNRSPQALGGASSAVHLYVDDVDALTRRAVKAGAKILIPVDDQFYGDRSGRLEDPFGHIWIVATHMEDVNPEEMQRRMETFMKQQG